MYRYNFQNWLKKQEPTELIEYQKRFHKRNQTPLGFLSQPETQNSLAQTQSQPQNNVQFLRDSLLTQLDNIDLGKNKSHFFSNLFDQRDMNGTTCNLLFDPQSFVQIPGNSHNLFLVGKRTNKRFMETAGDFFHKRKNQLRKNELEFQEQSGKLRKNLKYLVEAKSIKQSNSKSKVTYLTRIKLSASFIKELK
eukprot:403361780